MSRVIGTNKNILKFDSSYRSTGSSPETKLHITNDSPNADYTGGLVFCRRPNLRCTKTAFGVAIAAFLAGLGIGAKITCRKNGGK